MTDPPVKRADLNSVMKEQVDDITPKSVDLEALAEENFDMNALNAAEDFDLDAMNAVLNRANEATQVDVDLDGVMKRAKEALTRMNNNSDGSSTHAACRASAKNTVKGRDHYKETLDRLDIAAR